MKEWLDWIAERPEGQFLERKSCYFKNSGARASCACSAPKGESMKW